jgi:CubicO group peptidase (beta-lactamase class C family)
MSAIRNLRKTLFGIIVLLAADFATPDQVHELAGLWEAKRKFGPEIHGALTLSREGEKWFGQIANYSVRADVKEGQISFQIPGNRGSFTGRIGPLSESIAGHWIQPPITHNGLAFASPVLLKQVANNQWRGDVVPLEDEFTIYLLAEKKDDGTVGAFIRNPDRNIGVFLNVKRLEREGDSVKLIGTFGQNKSETVLADGIYHSAEGRLSIYIPNRGGTFDFVRVENDPSSYFYARGKQPARYVYRRPPEETDGWPTASADEAGISMQPIQELIESVIQAPAASVNAPYIHGLLIARHGKLVVEEYFHGFHNRKPHDTRSASKSLTSTLVGAAIQKGFALDASSPVYSSIYGKNLPNGLDPRKKAITIEHLLTMASGLNCDDSDPNSPGNEDYMQEQTEDTDWYRYTLNLPMIRQPGEKAVYCSANTNLIGAVLSSAAGRSLPELFQDLIATPLQIQNYYLDLMPTGQPYMGGGIYWMPRDFMKLGQVMLDDGQWNGKRILSSQWVKKAISPIVKIQDKEYGYAWWMIDFPYKGRTIRGFYAGGNGGQVVLGIPELDLLIAFYGGNYSDRVMFRSQQEFIPKYILPAVRTDE